MQTIFYVYMYLIVHIADGALSHAVCMLTHLMAHVATCRRVWLHTQPPVLYELYFVYICIYIYYFRVMAHVATCRVLLYTQHLRNDACCHMPCMVIHSTFRRQTINALCMY